MLKNGWKLIIKSKPFKKKLKLEENLKDITESLVDIMKTNDIEVMSTSDGQLVRTSRKVKSPLSKKHLLASLSVYFKNDPNIIKELSNYIMDSRPEKLHENIKRKKLIYINIYLFI